MYTSLMVIALSGVIAADTAQPTWQSDYATATKQSASAKKPLAVVLGTGNKGYEKLVREGGLQSEALQSLANNYVCVYIDTTTEAGKKLAQAFEMSSGTGIVISDRTGELQAFRHEGELSNSDLVGYLKRYGDPSYVVQRTEGGTTTRTSNYEAAEPDKKPVGGTIVTPTHSTVSPLTNLQQLGGSYCPSCSGSSGGGRRGR